MKILITFVLVLFSCAVNAQFQSNDGGMSAYRKIKTINYGTADAIAYYKVQFLKDSTQTGKYSEAQTFLQISNNYLCFGDYYQQIVDSIELDIAKTHKNMTQENANIWERAAQKMNFFAKVISDLKKGFMKVQLYTGLRDYEYTCPLPALDWQLLPGDSTINNMPCKKATCCYAGRKYIAWYTDKISLPYGPYVFQGLPGLIMDIRDTKNNWIFSNNGFRKVNDSNVLYLYAKGFISGSVKVTTRENALSALRNETENKNNLFLETAGVQVLENGKWITPEANKPRTPSNLLELEW